LAQDSGSKQLVPLLHTELLLEHQLRLLVPAFLFHRLEMNTMSTVFVSCSDLIMDVLLGAQTEIAVMILAACVHGVIFGVYRVPSTPRKKAIKVGNSPPNSGSKPSRFSAGRCQLPNQQTTQSQEAALSGVKVGIQQGSLEVAMKNVEGLAVDSEQSIPLAIETALIGLLRLAAEERRVPELMEKVRKNGLLRTASVFTAAVEACAGSRNMEAAHAALKEAEGKGSADSSVYTSLIKAYLHEGDALQAREVLAAMRSAGKTPSTVIYNELIDATVLSSPELAWRLLEEMQNSGIKANNITWSTLLKSVQAGMPEAEVQRAVKLLDNLVCDMDEVLLSSALEALIRAGRNTALARLLRKVRTRSVPIQIKGAQTYGSIIRACGFLQDMHGAWDAWQEMVTNKIIPTSITLGCMVEALVSHGDPESGHQLLKQAQSNSATKGLVNAVIYCSVLKGFSHQRRFAKAWEVYEEMLAANLQGQFTSVTYNTLIDVCARNGEIARAGSLLEGMAKQKIEPNLVTYSTILKGYCQENRLDQAFALLETMKKSASLKPDELVYNTLLDGCARQKLYSRGMAVFKEMQDVGVRPSNFTLSVLVKLIGRDRRLLEAFEVCDKVSRAYSFKLNVHVYNNLIQTCFTYQQKDTVRATGVLQRMLGEGVRPDARTYTLLLRGCVAAGQPQEAAKLMRAAIGLRNVHSCVAGHEAAASLPHGALTNDVIIEILEGIVRSHDGIESVSSLVNELKSRLPRLQLSARLNARLGRR